MVVLIPRPSNYRQRLVVSHAHGCDDRLTTSAKRWHLRIIHQPSNMEVVVSILSSLKVNFSTLSFSINGLDQGILLLRWVQVGPGIVVPQQAIVFRGNKERHHCFQVELDHGQRGVFVVDEAILVGAASIERLRRVA
eukprot:Skav208270  [mRNA]  locus=scaffold188:393261:397593:+ [translate_table: standard]